MTVEEGLFQRITESSAISIIIGSRFYPVLLPTEPVFPACTYQTISSIPEYTNDGPTGCLRTRIQIDCWGLGASSEDGYVALKNLARAIATLLDGFVGMLPNEVPVQNIWRDDSIDGFEPDSRLYRVQTDWIVVSTEL